MLEVLKSYSLNENRVNSYIVYKTDAPQNAISVFPLGEGKDRRFVIDFHLLNGDSVTKSFKTLKAAKHFIYWKMLMDGKGVRRGTAPYKKEAGTFETVSGLEVRYLLGGGDYPEYWASVYTVDEQGYEQQVASGHWRTDDLETLYKRVELNYGA